MFNSYGLETLTQKSNVLQYFDTITVVNCDAENLSKAFLENKINIRVIDSKRVSLSFSEITN